MAQATVVMFFLAAAELHVTPLPLAAKLVGCVLAGVIVAASVFLFMRQRSAVRQPGAISANMRWRTPTAVMMGVLGLLVFAGVWIDPTQSPFAFVCAWMLILAAAAILLLIAGLDLLQIRRQAAAQRLDLIRENRRLLEADLQMHKEKQPPSHHGSNGAHRL